MAIVDNLGPSEVMLRLWQPYKDVEGNISESMKRRTVQMFSSAKRIM